MEEVIKMEKEAATKVTIRMDGWSNRFRYEGFEIEYEIDGKKYVRLLVISTDMNKSHDAASMAKMINDLDKKYHFKHKLKAFGSDCASVNIKLSKDIKIDHDPCLCHKFNIVFNKFIQSLPFNIKDIISAANSLHHNQ